MRGIASGNILETEHRRVASERKKIVPTSQARSAHRARPQLPSGRRPNRCVQTSWRPRPWPACARKPLRSRLCGSTAGRDMVQDMSRTRSRSSPPPHATTRGRFTQDFRDWARPPASSRPAGGSAGACARARVRRAWRRASAHPPPPPPKPHREPAVAGSSPPSPSTTPPPPWTGRAYVCTDPRPRNAERGAAAPSRATRAAAEDQRAEREGAEPAAVRAAGGRSAPSYNFAEPHRRGGGGAAGAAKRRIIQIAAAECAAWRAASRVVATSSARFVIASLPVTMMSTRARINSAPDSIPPLPTPRLTPSRVITSTTTTSASNNAQPLARLPNRRARGSRFVYCSRDTREEVVRPALLVHLVGPRRKKSRATSPHPAGRPGRRVCCSSSDRTASPSVTTPPTHCTASCTAFASSSPFFRAAAMVAFSSRAAAGS